MKSMFLLVFLYFLYRTHSFKNFLQHPIEDEGDNSSKIHELGKKVFL